MDKKWIKTARCDAFLPCADALASSSSPSPSVRMASQRENKSSMDLKRKIFDQVGAARTGQKTVNQATNEILLLLDVEGRSEQLLAFAKWIQENANHMTPEKQVKYYELDSK